MGLIYIRSCVLRPPLLQSQDGIPRHMVLKTHFNVLVHIVCNECLIKNRNNLYAIITLKYFRPSQHYPKFLHTRISHNWIDNNTSVWYEGKTDK